MPFLLVALDKIQWHYIEHISMEYYTTAIFVLKFEAFVAVIIWLGRAGWGVGDGYFSFCGGVGLRSGRGGWGMCRWVVLSCISCSSSVLGFECWYAIVWVPLLGCNPLPPNTLPRMYESGWLVEWLQCPFSP